MQENALDNPPKTSSLRRNYALHPKQLAYRLPGEWETHESSWLIWPHSHTSWPGRRAKVETVVAKMIALLSRHETTHVVVHDGDMERHARMMIGRNGPGEIHFHHFTTNCCWVRNQGATIVRRTETDGQFPDRIAIDWGFAGSREQDDGLAHRMASSLHHPCVSGGICLSGGSFDSNGTGVVLVSEDTIIGARLNPALGKPEATDALNRMLGTSKVIWIGINRKDPLEIDQLARFTAPNQIVISAPDEEDLGAAGLVNQLGESTDANGISFEVVHLPPPTWISAHGARIRASYTNFYLANGVVLVPQYASHRDQESVQVLSSLFPDREAVGIDCTDIISQHGSLHSLVVQAA